MMPVVLNDGVFFTAPHGKPGIFYRLLPPESGDESGTVGVEEGWTSRLDTCQGGVVHVGDRLYGSFYPGRKGWAAIDARTGEVLYEEPGFVKGAVLYADQRLYALSEEGWMLLLEPGVSRFDVRGKFRFIEATDRDAWAHPVILDGKMYLRYHDRLTCFSIQETQ
jgi:hypothetical protein